MTYQENIDKSLKQITTLVNRFQKNEQHYKKYSEEDTKNEFINPFFEALGWDVNNKEGKLPNFKDVICEEQQKLSRGKSQQPDYTFRIGGTSVFYAEAKNITEKLDDKKYAYQIKRYGYNSGFPLSILTNFKEFIVYDTRNKPKPNDNPSLNIIEELSCKYTEYCDKWENISAVFSKNAVVTGNYINFLSNNKKNLHGSSPLDDDFIEEVTRWRQLLARNIALRNKDLSNDELNYAIEQIINRILFFRIAEARNIEKEGSLKKLIDVDKDESIYSRFIEKCVDAYYYYSNDLFNFYQISHSDDSDKITYLLNIDDNILKEIFSKLYYPSIYIFNEMDLDILGKIYERFLSEEIYLTKKHYANYNFDLKTRKKKGVYYTPKKVTKHIIRNTVAKLVNGKTPEEISKIHILDPACGSGSFLIEAYNYLLEYHLNYYLENSKEKLFKDKNGNFFLTIDEKIKILTNNIYGVDIDSRATEITKLSLLLKIFDNYEMSHDDFISFFQKLSKLDLNRNIKCGNSVVDLDCYDDYRELYHNMEHPFDYKSEFPEVFTDNNNGFDIIIGNPPYIRTKRSHKKFKDYLSKHYKLYTKQADIYVVFFEKALNLLKKGGMLGFLCSNQFISTKYGRNLRRELSENNFILEYDECKNDIFKDASVNTSIFIIQRIPEKNKEIIIRTSNKKYLFNQNNLDENHWIIQSSKYLNLYEKIIEKSTTIKYIREVTTHSGINPGKKSVYIIDKKLAEDLIRKDPKNRDIVKPVIEGKDINKWQMNYDNLYIVDTQYDINIKKNYPVIYDYLYPYKKQLRKRTNKGVNWYNLRQCSYHDYFYKPKLIYPEIKENILTYFDNSGILIYNKCFMITHIDNNEDFLKVLGAIFSSNVMNFYIRIVLSPLGGSYSFYKNVIDESPIATFNLHNSIEKDLIDLVDEIQSMNVRLQKLEKKPELKVNPAKKDFHNQLDRLKKQINNLDKQINSKVYELYDLTEDEIRLIEEKLGIEE